jgi:hypothetical protein
MSVVRTGVAVREERGPQGRPRTVQPHTECIRCHTETPRLRSAVISLKIDRAQERAVLRPQPSEDIVEAAARLLTARHRLVRQRILASLRQGERVI